MTWRWAALALNLLASAGTAAACLLLLRSSGVAGAAAQSSSSSSLHLLLPGMTSQWTATLALALSFALFTTAFSLGASDAAIQMRVDAALTGSLEPDVWSERHQVLASLLVSLACVTLGLVVALAPSRPVWDAGAAAVCFGVFTLSVSSVWQLRVLWRDSLAAEYLPLLSHDGGPDSPGGSPNSYGSSDSLESPASPTGPMPLKMQPFPSPALQRHSSSRHVTFHEKPTVLESVVTVQTSPSASPSKPRAPLLRAPLIPAKAVTK